MVLFTQACSFVATLLTKKIPWPLYVYTQKLDLAALLIHMHAHTYIIYTRGTLCAGDSSLSSQFDLAHAQVSHICTRYCTTVINGAVHSKYTEEKSADSFCEPDSEKNSVVEGSSFRPL